MKLSKTQLEVLRLMNEGWELGRTSSSFSGERQWWMQKGELGCGGETKSLNARTCWKLYDLGLIEKPNPNLEFPTEHWRLTDKGKTELAHANQMEHERQERIRKAYADVHEMQPCRGWKV
jgi:hypothetical protein